MGFVKTPEEIERIRHAVTHVEFNGGEALSLSFLTDAAFIAETLPPGLEPLDEPRMSATVCRFRSGSAGTFAGGAVYIAARHGDIVGRYTLAMYMDADQAILFGRDLYGEPKKLCQVVLDVDGDRAYGSITRNGVRLIEIDATLGEDTGPTSGGGKDFNYKASLATDGDGLADDPILTLTELEGTMASVRSATGTVTLDGNAHDPLHEIPVGELSPGAYASGADYRAKARALTRVPAEAFLPYAYGRLPDWDVHLTEGRALEVR
jgi:acetoacetate decarboxylase